MSHVGLEESIASTSSMPHWHKVLVELTQICATTCWEYAEIWQPRTVPGDSHVLELNPAWALKPSMELSRAHAWQQFRLCSKAFVISVAEGLPGRVWINRTPEWITDTSAYSETYFLRNQIAKAFGVGAGLGVPLIIDNQVTAVFVFFSSAAMPKEPNLLQQTVTLVQNLLPVFKQSLRSEGVAEDGQA